MKICSVCGVKKSLIHFPTVGSRCKDCKKLYMKDYVKRKPEIEAARSLRSNEKRKETSKRKTQIKRLAKILSSFAELKENPFKFKKITEVPIAILTPEQKKERNRIQQMEWRAKNKDKILKSKKKYRDKNKSEIIIQNKQYYALKNGKTTLEQIEFNNELKKALAEMGF